MEILAITRTKTRIAAITDAELLLAIEEVEQTIKNYCNINEVPKGLIYIWANMARDLALYEYHSDPANSTADDDFNMSGITNIKVGDTQIATGGVDTSDKGKAKAGHRLNLDGITMNYQKQLNQYRKMVW